MDKFYIDFINRVGMERFLPTFEEIFAKHPQELEKLGNDYVNSTISQSKIEKDARALFSEYHPNTVEVALQIAASKPLLNLYLKRGYTEEQFYNSMYDVKNKYEEGIYFNGIEGTHCVAWQRKFFRLELIGVGIFQYELGRIVESKEGFYKHGVSINVGDDLLCLHIPSGINFSKEERLKSYKMAYEFFKDRLIDGKLVFFCTSWLIFPDFEKDAFKKGNVHDFMHEFEIVETHPYDGFTDAHRVFGNIKNLKVEDYPENTSLQRAFKQKMLRGDNFGYGYGFFVFDGEKILTQN